MFSLFKPNKKHVNIIIINDSIILEMMQRYRCGLWNSIIQVVGLPCLNNSKHNWNFKKVRNLLIQMIMFLCLKLFNWARKPSDSVSSELDLLF